MAKNLDKLRDAVQGAIADAHTTALKELMEWCDMNSETLVEAFQRIEALEARVRLLETSVEYKELPE